MALTAYCKKCNQEVAPGEICPQCGTKLAKTATHAAWVIPRRPAADWMCWNAAIRWLLPAGAAVVILALLLEGLAGGTAAVEVLLSGSFPWAVLSLLGGILVILMLVLILQGKELMDYVVDSRGVHVTRYLPNPTPLKLILRMKSPGMMDQVNPEAVPPLLRLEEKNLPWREIARVQLWPEKCYLLFYSPAWWLRIPVRCTPFSWEDALTFVRDKLGKRKAVDLPEHLRTPAEKKPPARRNAGRVSPAPAAPEKSPWSDPEDAAPAEEEIPADVGEQLSLEI